MSARSNGVEASTNKISQQYPMAEILPHAGRMILIDEVLSFDENRLSAKVLIKETTLFLSDGKVPVRVGIEYMAQTIAAWAGVHAKNRAKPVKVGYLLGSRRYQSLITSFALGDVLTIQVEKAYDANDIGVFECHIILREKIAVTATLNVYQPG